MKFTHLYEELKLLDICKPASPEEAEKRNTEYPAVRFKEALKYADKTKLPDGTWHVHGNLNISECNLSTLENLNVSIVDKDFVCYANQLTSLIGCPKEIGGNFSCYNNKLTSLEGCPIKVGGRFSCARNNLTSLKGCPKKVNGSFYCYDNQLTSLERCPTRIGGNFSCYNNKLTSLEGCPKKVTEDFFCYNNRKDFTDADVKALCDVKGKIYV